VEVTLVPKNCALRNTPIKLWCFQGAECYVPLPTRGNFGSFFAPFSAPYLPSLWDDFEVRVIVAGHDADYQIRHMSSQSACDVVTSDQVTFCTAKSGSNVWGAKTTFPQKDAYAQQFYSELVTAFSCKQSTGCDCVQLTQPCLDNLKTYACDTALSRCNASGFVLTPDYTLVQSIETNCGATFVDAGLYTLSDGHNYYNGGILFVPGGDSDGKTDVPSQIASGPNVGLIVGAVIGAIVALILLIIIIILIARAVQGGASAASPPPSSGTDTPKPANPYVIL